MTVRASKFTPHVLLSAPRRSAGIPNADCSKILYSTSTYSFASHSKTSEIRILDVESLETTLVTYDPSASNPQWLGDEILFFTSGDDGCTHVNIGATDPRSSYIVATIDGPVDNLKLCSIGRSPLDYDYAFAVTGKATPEGHLYNPFKAKKPHTTGRLYNSMFVRHWDTYVTENRNSIWIGKLSRNFLETRFKLSKLRNALKDTGLESPVEPFGGTDHFDISPLGLVFTAKDPDLNPALHTRTNIYLCRFVFYNFPDIPLVEPKKIEYQWFKGACTSPAFSPSGAMLVYLSMKEDGYESGKNRIVIVPNIMHPEAAYELFPSPDHNGAWDRSPQSITWGPAGKELNLYLTAEDHGRGCLFECVGNGWGVPGKRPFAQPQMLVRGGSISDVRALKNGDLFLSSTSLIENSLYSVLPFSSREKDKVYSLPDGITPSDQTTVYISSQSKLGAAFGLSRNQIDEVHWPGAKCGTSIHAWVVKPSNFDPEKTYPLAYLIHGGPQGAWEDGWSTRWNPAVFAEQGYVVITPNPTGSTGYGQEFTDAIKGQWGGLPYEDLVKGFHWIRDNMSFVDTDKAVALGASYGGYMSKSRIPSSFQSAHISCRILTPSPQ